MRRGTAEKLAAAAMVGAALLHFVYTASNGDDPAALLYFALGVVQLGLAIVLLRRLPIAVSATIWINAALIIAFVLMETAGPALGMKPESIGPLTVLRKGFEVAATAVLIFDRRRTR